METSFEKASRIKLRFKSPVGIITTEDLWDLDLDNLNSLAKYLNKAVKDAAEENFIVKKSKAIDTLELGFEIVKYVIKVKLEEAEAKKLRAERKVKNQRIMEIISHKEDEALSNKSIEELKTLMEEE